MRSYSRRLLLPISPRPADQHPPARRRGAILSMELVLILPIFLTLIFGVVELSMLTLARSRVHDAARHGARLMSMSGASDEDVRAVIERTLGPTLKNRAQVSITPGKSAGALGSVSVAIPMNSATPDLLWPIGFSVRGKVMRASAMTVMEHDPSVSQVASAPANQQLYGGLSRHRN
ncbi:MAG: pilus assembly protein [Planctomycetaceae bacterium]|nr:pilus assembly protein [Planctomycetaceae bacterium]